MMSPELLAALSGVVLLLVFFLVGWRLGRRHESHCKSQHTSTPNEKRT